MLARSTIWKLFPRSPALPGTTLSEKAPPTVPSQSLEVRFVSSSTPTTPTCLQRLEDLRDERLGTRIPNELQGGRLFREAHHQLFENEPSSPGGRMTAFQCQIGFQ